MDRRFYQIQNKAMYNAYNSVACHNSSDYEFYIDAFTDGANFADKYKYLDLEDCGGNQLAVGDVVEVQDSMYTLNKSEIGYLAYLKQECGFVVVFENRDVRIGHRNLNGSSMKLIGNIYDNPELISWLNINKNNYEV